MIWYPLQNTESYKIQQKMLLYDMVSTIEDRQLQNTTENVIIGYGITTENSQLQNTTENVII